MGFNPLKIAAALTGPGAAIMGSQWANSRSKGANAVNDALGQRYADLTGGVAPGQTAKLNRPAKPDSPLKSMIGNLTGGYNAARDRSNALFDENSNTFRSFMGSNGGLDPNRIAALEGDIANFRNIGRHGAGDAAGAARLRGGGVYDEFSRTGGYSDKDIENIRERSNSQIPTFFAGLKRNLENQNKVQGGFNPGYTSQNAKMSRDAGRMSVDAARDTEVGIKEKVNEGRRWGTEGMSASEQAIVRNMLAGLEGASGNESALMQAIRQGQMFGAQGMEGLRTNAGADLAYGNQLLEALGLEGNQINQVLGMMGERNPNLTNFDKHGDKIMRGAAAILGM